MEEPWHWLVSSYEVPSRFTPPLTCARIDSHFAPAPSWKLGERKHAHVLDFQYGRPARKIYTAQKDGMPLPDSRTGNYLRSERGAMERKRCQHCSIRTVEIFLVTALAPLHSRQLICVLATLHRCVRPGVQASDGSGRREQGTRNGKAQSQNENGRLEKSISPLLKQPKRYRPIKQ